MDPFYSFLAFAIILALELMANQSWLAVYFRFGIPVNFTHRKLLRDTSAPEQVDPGELGKTLAERFQNRPGIPTVRFKALPGAPLRADLAFHETLFDPSSRSRYLPLIHSLARLDLRRGVVSVTGYVNWYVLFVLVYLVFSTMADRSFVFVDVVVVLIFALSYFAQATINRMVAKEVEAIISGQSGKEE